MTNPACNFQRFAWLEPEMRPLCIKRRGLNGTPAPEIAETPKKKPKLRAFYPSSKPSKLPQAEKSWFSQVSILVIGYAISSYPNNKVLRTLFISIAPRYFTGHDRAAELPIAYFPSVGAFAFADF